SRLREVLGGGGGSAEPAVVRDVDEQARSVGDELPDRIGGDGFIADEDAKAAAGQFADGIARTGAEIADKPGEASGKKERVSPGNEFTERNEMDFVVEELLAAPWAEESRAVVRRSAIVGAAGAPVQFAKQKVAVRSLRDRGDPCGEIGLLKRE